MNRKNIKEFRIIILSLKPNSRIKGIYLIAALLISVSCSRNTSLLISDGSVFVPGEHFPEFSWSTTPQYFMFGDSDEVLTPKEVDFISERTAFVCIEKCHGLIPLGAAELGAKHEVEAFKLKDPDIKVLFYFNSAWAYPFTSYSKQFDIKKIENYPEFKSYLLLNQATGELNRRGTTLSFDVLNPDFRDWWVETVISGMNTAGADGVFVDQMHGFFFLRKDKKAEVLRAMGEMLTELKEGMGEDKILLANNANDDIAGYVYPAIDATMFEHYNISLSSKDNLLKEWDDMLKNARAGKMLIFRFGVEHDYNGENKKGTPEYTQDIIKLSRKRLEFYLSCFLIGAQPYSYFQYGWGWNTDHGSLIDYPELLKPLGAPKGAYERTDPGKWEFTREFEHASVWLNTEIREGKITWK